MNIRQIPIINYHKVIPSFDIGITSRHPRQFESDMKILSDNGYQTITFKQYHNKKDLPEKPIIITFDDGYESFIRFASPILEKFGFHCVVYIPTSFIGKLNDWDVQFGKLRFRHLNDEQIRTISAQGHEIGSHGHMHQNLCKFPADALKYELAESKHIIEGIIREKIHSISYPFGRFNSNVLNTAQEAGYQFGVSAIYFKSISPDLETMSLKRFNIYRFDSKSVFKKKLKMTVNGLLGIRDWCIQRGGSATSILQKVKK